MLGPFSLAQGQTAHFCWKLERAGSPRGSKRLQTGGVGPSASDRGQVRQPTAAEDEGVAARTHEVLCDEVHYEITASSDSWRTGGTRRGQVWLPRRVGASATIEAAWTPLMEGFP